MPIVTDSVVNKIRSASACYEMLEGVAELTARFRKTGATTALIAAASDRPGAVVIAHSEQHAKQLYKDYPGIEFNAISLANIRQRLIGLPRETLVLIDNAATSALAGVAAQSISLLKSLSLDLLGEAVQQEKAKLGAMDAYDRSRAEVGNLRLQVEMLQKQVEQLTNEK